MIDGLCELCDAALVERGRVPAYQAPNSYEILDCQACNTMVSQPKKLVPSIYDAIYSVPGGAPGYDRNFQYARRVTRVKYPLAYLASRQDAFWGVEHLLAELTNPRVLEVGCGLGYLTYALRRAGYDALGIDVSPEAVASATRVFGHFYRAESIESYASKCSDTFDAIVMVEVIEHLEDPVKVLQSAMRLLAPGGSVIVSTPNRSFFAPGSDWATDLPPVHLWWFSEDSMHAMARRLGYNVSLVDFTEYSSTYPILHVYRPPLAPMFDESGQLARREAALIHVARRLGILQEAYWLVSRAVGRFRSRCSPRRPNLVAAFGASALAAG
jgi:SAM-dependent methyltransferase